MTHHNRTTVAHPTVAGGGADARATSSRPAHHPSRGARIDAAQDRYNKTRSHKALVRLQDAVHDVLRAEL